MGEVMTATDYRWKVMEEGGMIARYLHPSPVEPLVLKGKILDGWLPGSVVRAIPVVDENGKLSLVRLAVMDRLVGIDDLEVFEGVGDEVLDPSAYGPLKSSVADESEEVSDGGQKASSEEASSEEDDEEDDETGDQRDGSADPPGRAGHAGSGKGRPDRPKASPKASRKGD